MQKNKKFVKQLLKRFDRIDRDSLQVCVSELGKENLLMRQVCDELTEGVALAGKTGVIQYMNRAASVYLGISAGSSKPGNLFLARDSQLGGLLKMVFSKIKDKTVEDVHVMSPKSMELRVTVCPLEEGEETVYLVLFSAKEFVAEEHIQSARMARIEALIKLAAGVAHEIGNPLGALSIHLQLLQKAVKKMDARDKKPLEQSLNAMSSETDRLDRIVKNFLKATRKPPLRFRLESLPAVMREAIDLLAPELKRNKTTLVFDKNIKLPDFFFDHDRIYQVFINLIKNAMESTGSGGKITVKMSHEGKIAMVTVQDNGAGIDEEDLPKIFDAYYTTKEEGSGLGLMTVYETIHEHGGRIEVESEPKKGALFRILLPMRMPSLQLPEYPTDVSRNQSA